MLNIEKRIDLPDDIFHLFRDIIYKHCGVVLDESSKTFVENRLQRSVLRRKFDNFRDYYYFLKYDRKKDEELSNVIDLLTIHETYFFREEQQLKTFSDEVLPEVFKAKSQEKSLRIWSAGCSTGEEPYTISIIINEKKEFKNWNVEIIGTDVSQRVLQSARRGLYQSTAFRVIDPRYISMYFHKEEDGYKINDDVKKNVVFLNLNVMDENKMALINSVDIIFCRNMIIYFDQDGKRNVINSFYRKLKVGGYLLLGHSESLINISTAFALRHFKYDMLYQKVDQTKEKQ